MKHWVKRPLYPQLVEYAVSGVDPLWDLGQRMMKSVGQAGVAGTIRMSKTSIQYYYDLADQEPSPEEKRYACLFAQLVAVDAAVLVIISDDILCKLDAHLLYLCIKHCLLVG